MNSEVLNTTELTVNGINPTLRSEGNIFMPGTTPGAGEGPSTGVQPLTEGSGRTEVQGQGPQGPTPEAVSKPDQVIVRPRSNVAAEARRQASEAAERAEQASDTKGPGAGLEELAGEQTSPPAVEAPTNTVSESETTARTEIPDSSASDAAEPAAAPETSLAENDASRRQIETDLENLVRSGASKDLISAKEAELERLEQQHKDLIAPPEPPNPPGPTTETGVPQPEVTEPPETTTETADAEPVVITETEIIDEAEANDTPLFSFVVKAQKSLEEAEDRGDLSVNDRAVLESRLQQAVEKENLLYSSLSRIKTEEARGGRIAGIRGRIRSLVGRGTDYDQAVKDTRNQQKQLYEDKLFEPLKQAAERDKQHPYDELLGNALADAKSMRSEAELQLKQAESLGNQDAINIATQRRDAMNQNFFIIRNEKRKAKLKSSLLGIILLSITTAIMEPTKQVNEGVKSSQQPQRR